jgi:hypothetical protein
MTRLALSRPHGVGGDTLATTPDTNRAGQPHLLVLCGFLEARVLVAVAFLPSAT